MCGRHKQKSRKRSERSGGGEGLHMEIWTTAEPWLVTPPSKLMPASATLGQILLNPPGLMPSHSAAPVLSTSDPGSAILGAPDRCQGPLTLIGRYHIHQVDQRSDLSLFLSDPRLPEVLRPHANMMEVGNRKSHTLTLKNFFFFLRTCQRLREHVWWICQRWSI